MSEEFEMFEINIESRSWWWKYFKILTMNGSSVFKISILAILDDKLMLKEE